MRTHTYYMKRESIICQVASSHVLFESYWLEDVGNVL